jgi:outer membrane lipoprotein-sorting protein
LADELPDPRREGLTTSQKLEQLLARVALEQGKMESMQASFVQYKESVLLLEPQVSRGEFLFVKPDKVLWEYTEPEPIRVVIHGEEMLTWYRDLGRAERVMVGSYSDRILEYMGASNSLELLRKYFDLRVLFPSEPEAPYRVELLPRFERVAKRIAGMSLEIDPERFLPTTMRYEEADGDLTEYRFEDLVINGTVPEDGFDLGLPEGVEVHTVELGAN